MAILKLHDMYIQTDHITLIEFALGQNQEPVAVFHIAHRSMPLVLDSNVNLIKKNLERLLILRLWDKANLYDLLAGEHEKKGN